MKRFLDRNATFIQNTSKGYQNRFIFIFSSEFLSVTEFYYSPRNELGRVRSKKVRNKQNICWKLHAIVRLKVKVDLEVYVLAPGTSARNNNSISAWWKSYQMRQSVLKKFPRSQETALVWSSQCSAHTYNFSFLLFTFELFLVSRSHECVPTKSLC